MGTIPKVISLNDSDLKEPIELVHRELEVKVGVVNPHRWDAGVGLCSRHSSGKFGRRIFRCANLLQVFETPEGRFTSR